MKPGMGTTTLAGLRSAHRARRAVTVMTLFRLWAALFAQRQRSDRVRLTWQTCRRCGSYSFLPAGSDGRCGGCLSLQITDTAGRFRSKFKPKPTASHPRTAS